MRFKKTFSAAAIILAAGISIAGCTGNSTGNSATKAESKAQAQDSFNLINNQPIPVYQFSQMRAALIDIQDLEAQGENTTSFFFNQGVQNPITSCLSRGMPIPASAELTNPYQALWNNGGTNGNAGVAVGQMDPTGIYTGDTSGTNVVCVNAKGQKYLQYWEGFVDTVSGAAIWNNNTHQVQLLGTPDTLKHLQK